MRFRLPGSSSLVRRLILLAAGWSLIALVITAFLLSTQFRNATVNRVDGDLAGLAESLFANVYVADDNTIQIPQLPDNRFKRTYSGRYWEVYQLSADNAPVRAAASESLFGGDIDPPPVGFDAMQRQAGKPMAYDTIGPDKKPVRAIAILGLSIPDYDAPLLFVAAEERSTLDREIRAFVATTTIALILLGLFIIAGVWLQVRIGLQPLFALRREVEEVRKGRADRLAGDYPAELAPLAQELNALVAHNHEVVERQRTHVGNLAHALKTPISVMLAEAGARPGPLAEVVRRQSQAMHSHVEHHLQRARAAARAQGNREVTPVEPVIDELARTLERIFQDKGISMDWTCPPDLGFRGERQDLLEIAGNVLENACKWSAGKVVVTVEARGDGVFAIVIEDNGPGLPADRRSEVLKRGARLDEATPGTGLGLSIVDELARAYGGGIALGDSALGGLKVELTLPRAES